jgi:hypothetical protein
MHDILEEEKIVKKHKQRNSLVINRSRWKDNIKIYIAEIKHQFKV